MEHFYKNLWRWKCNIPEQEKQKPFTFEELYVSEWDSEFELLMRNRLVIGAFRYGKNRSENKPKYNRVESMIKRLNKYTDTGNKEFLVDVANLCLLEFIECYHPKAHFKSIDDGEHVKVCQ